MFQSNNKKTTLLERISNIDFEQIYTPKIRIITHLSMWLFFDFLLFLNYYVDASLPTLTSFLLATRAVINNACVFYIIFYLLLPKVFNNTKWGFYLIILCLPFCIYLWLTINHLQYDILNYLKIDVFTGPLQGVVSRNASENYLQAISIKRVLGNAMPVIYSIAPSFFAKILFDITRLFNKTIKIQKQNSDLELQNINIEKDFLKAQLNPHFLFNTLNNLYGLVVTKNTMAPETIINISNLMSYTLYESNTERVPIQKELEFIENYFFLEKMRYSSNKDIKLTIVNSSETQFEIAPLLFFSFIENGFKYGLKSTKGNFLHIKVEITNNILYFSIENDKENTSEKSVFGGIGVQNAKKRLNLLYPNRHKLEINDNENSFFVSLRINLQ